MKKKILIFINKDTFFLSHRLKIGLIAIKYGYEVHLFGNIMKYSLKLKKYGFKVHHSKHTKNNFKNFFFYLIDSLSIIRKINPDILHLITLKNIVLAGIVSKFFINNNIKILCSITGLGYFFTDNHFKTIFFKKIISVIIKYIFQSNNFFLIFQNYEDKKIIKNIIGFKKVKTYLLKGVGVDIKKFKYKTYKKKKKLTFIFISRLLIHKGIREYIELAKYFKKNRLDSKFIVIGEYDTNNPSCISRKEIMYGEKKKYITYLGYKNNIYKHLNSSNIFIFPSYQEGLPKVILEAQACGLPTIASDIAGCKEIIKNNYNGFLVKKKNVTDLIIASKKIYFNEKLGKKFSRNGRKIIEKNFNDEKVALKHLDIYKKLN